MTPNFKELREEWRRRESYVGPGACQDMPKYPSVMRQRWIGFADENKDAILAALSIAAKMQVKDLGTIEFTDGKDE